MLAILSSDGAEHRLRVPPAGQAGPEASRRPGKAAQGDRAQEGGRLGRGAILHAAGKVRHMATLMQEQKI